MLGGGGERDGDQECFVIITSLQALSIVFTDLQCPG